MTMATEKTDSSMSMRSCLCCVVFWNGPSKAAADDAAQTEAAAVCVTGRGQMLHRGHNRNLTIEFNLSPHTANDSPKR